jgi:hypothetical protein
LPMDLMSNPAAGRDGIFRKKYGIWRNQERNAAFAAAVRKLPEDEQALIMVATIEHAVHLGKLLPDFRLVYGSHDLDDFRRYGDADMLQADFEPVIGDRRERMRLDFESGALRKVISTDVWSTGVSFDALSTLIRADARSSTIRDEQIPGRVSRAHTPTDKRVGRLIDSADGFDRGFAAAASGRRNNYLSKGWEEEGSTTPARRRPRR